MRYFGPGWTLMKTTTPRKESRRKMGFVKIPCLNAWKCMEVDVELVRPNVLSKSCFDAKVRVARTADATYKSVLFVCYSGHSATFATPPPQPHRTF